MQRLDALTAQNHTEFDAILTRLTAEEGGLNPGECVRIDLEGAFRADPHAPNEDVNWDQVEEAQMRARLEGLPDGYWATLRGSGCADTLYFDVLRLDA